MRAAILAIVFLTAPCAAPALEVPDPATVRAALDASPTTEAARASLAADLSRAKGLRVGPHEITIAVEGDRRSIDGGDYVTEWTVGLRRGVRWPWKGSLDGRAADLTVEAAELRSERTRRDAVRAFVTTWDDWSLAQALLERAKADADDARVRVDLQRRRLASGMGQEIELDQLVSDAALAELAVADARRRVSEATRRFVSAFPSLDPASLPTVDLSTVPQPDDAPACPTIGLARLEREQAGIDARRAAHDRLPDPEIGLFWFDELGGTETGLGASFSIPIPGRNRAAAAATAHAEQIQRIAEARAKERDASTRIALARETVDAAFRALDLAREATDAARTAVGRMERGRELDVVTVTELIVARRSLRATEAVRVEREHALIRARLEWAIVASGWPGNPISPRPAP